MGFSRNHRNAIRHVLARILAITREIVLGLGRLGRQHGEESAEFAPAVVAGAALRIRLAQRDGALVHEEVDVRRRGGVAGDVELRR